MSMTADARKALSQEIRALREYLLQQLANATQSTYLLFQEVPAETLTADQIIRRAQLTEWIESQVRARWNSEGHKKPPKDKERDDLRQHFLQELIKEAAYTLLNRHVYLRLLEGCDLRKETVLTGGWSSRGYREFREIAPALCEDESEGYGFLLRLVFDELATDLPALFGSQSPAEAIPVSVAALRHLVERLDQDVLKSCWKDDMTLGWVYQYWNDPEREMLDQKISERGKIENHEIASKTQLFTERYMVDWMLQNTLGRKWLAICQKNGWTADIIASGTLDALEQKRAAWRKQRESGAVELTDLMPLDDAQERRWVYYVPQEIDEDAIQQAPASIRELRLLDPACGSGHFLVNAMEMLFALYQEEARHRGCSGDNVWSDKQIVEDILQHNLHGIDIDPRALQIAAAALLLKARMLAKEASPQQLQLVAPQLQLAQLPAEDPVRRQFQEALVEGLGLSADSIAKLLDLLAGAEHLGSLLKIEAALQEVLASVQMELTSDQAVAADHHQDAQALLLDKLEAFLAKQGGSDDLGLRLRCDQLAAGLRFLRMIQEDQYDIVIGNPPYQGTSKMADKAYLERHYPEGKADLYAAFLMRAPQLCKQGGFAALLTMRGWMFITQYTALRNWLFSYPLLLVGDVEKGAFSEIGGEVVSASMTLFAKSPLPKGTRSLAIRPTPPDTRDVDSVQRKITGLQCQAERFLFDVQALRGIEGWPLIYWWDADFLQRYVETPKLGEVTPARAAQSTGDNTRFTRRFYEDRFYKKNTFDFEDSDFYKKINKWFPFVNGAKGFEWFEPLREILNWKNDGIEIKNSKANKTGNDIFTMASQEFFFKEGIAFSMIGSSFSARIHRYASVFGNMGSSVFTPQKYDALCSMNSINSQYILQSLNPGVHFEVGDVNRLPMVSIDGAEQIYHTLEAAFSEHESHRETSVEFKQPGPSAWASAQAWAQQAVDRPEGTPLPPYTPTYDEPTATDHLSFALGVALGRFGAAGEGILDPSEDDMTHALPHGLLFLDGTLDPTQQDDSLGEPAATVLHEAWKKYDKKIAKNTDLRTYLRLKFFGDVHEKMYEGKPIHWPLSSAKKTFVAYVTIHRMNEQTLRHLLAFSLSPAQERLEQRKRMLQERRNEAKDAEKKKADKEYHETSQALDELTAFIADVKACAEKGAPPTDAKCPAREVDASYAPVLDDGVMINAAVLWPLLEPQWKKPKAWWKELAQASGKKDYDWSHLARRYFPERVEAKCKQDPSLGVAHGCFWRYHPARAWAWELRLQQEIGPDFVIEEMDADTARHRFLLGSGKEAVEILEKEVLRRERKEEGQQGITLNRAGLWTHHAEEMWDLEMRLMAKLERVFVVDAPDAAAARASYAAEHPKKKKAREQLLAGITQPQMQMF